MRRTLNLSSGPETWGNEKTLGLMCLVHENQALIHLIEFVAFWLLCFVATQLKQDMLSQHCAHLPSGDPPVSQSASHEGKTLIGVSEVVVI